MLYVGRSFYRFREYESATVSSVDHSLARYTAVLISIFSLRFLDTDLIIPGKLTTIRDVPLLTMLTRINLRENIACAKH